MIKICIRTLSVHQSLQTLPILIIIIKCMCSHCRRDDIHVCFAYASPQCMPHMYDNKRVSLKYIKLIENN